MARTRADNVHRDRKNRSTNRRLSGAARELIERAGQVARLRQASDSPSPQGATYSPDPVVAEAEFRLDLAIERYLDGI